MHGHFRAVCQLPYFIYSLSDNSSFSLIPETKGRSLEDMDVIFGSISAEERQAHIKKYEKQGALLLKPSRDCALITDDDLAQEYNGGSSNSLRDEKV